MSRSGMSSSIGYADNTPRHGLIQGFGLSFLRLLMQLERRIVRFVWPDGRSGRILLLDGLERNYWQNGLSQKHFGLSPQLKKSKMLEVYKQRLGLFGLEADIQQAKIVDPMTVLGKQTQAGQGTL